MRLQIEDQEQKYKELEDQCRELEEDLENQA